MMPGEKTFLNERLTYRLSVLAEQAIAANDEIFVAETGCRIREMRVLRLIDDSPGTTFREIARATGMERSLTSRIIQGLITGGLVERTNSGSDARVFKLNTTKKGRRIRAKGRKVSDRLEAILTSPLTRDDLQILDALLARMAAWVSSEEYAEALLNEKTQ